MPQNDELLCCSLVISQINYSFFEAGGLAAQQVFSARLPLTTQTDQGILCAFYVFFSVFVFPLLPL